MPNILGKYKKWTPANMMETHIKKDKKKASSEFGSHSRWTNQTHDIRHEIGMTP